jgi:hypothetical protein
VAESALQKRCGADTGRWPPGLWRVRITVPGAQMHLVSSTEPEVRLSGGRVERVVLTLVEDLGDTIGYIDWPTVVAVTWRRAVAVAAGGRHFVV